MDLHDVLMVLCGVLLYSLWRNGIFGILLCTIGIHGKRKEYTSCGPGFYWGVTVCNRCGHTIKLRDVQKQVEPSNPSIPYKEIK